MDLKAAITPIVERFEALESNATDFTTKMTAGNISDMLFGFTVHPRTVDHLQLKLQIIDQTVASLDAEVASLDAKYHDALTLEKGMYLALKEELSGLVS